MKRCFFTLVLLSGALAAYTQADTLYTKRQEKIPCKIKEIGEFDIRYTLAQNEDGPLYVINKSSVFKYMLSNGFTELLLPDELSIENEHEQIIKNRTAIKFHPFSGVNNQLSFAYEKVVRVGTNVDFEVGYINSRINRNTSSLGSGVSYSGAYIKPGFKFFLGQDFSIKGLKYAHPLKGRYVKLDLAVSYLNINDLKAFDVSSGIITRTVTTTMNTAAYGAFVNIGRQHILGNVLILDYYFGAGFTGESYGYTNPEYLKIMTRYGEYTNPTVNYHGFIRVPTLGLSFTAGLRVGYILPEPKHKRTRASQFN